VNRASFVALEKGCLEDTGVGGWNKDRRLERFGALRGDGSLTKLT